MHGLGTEFGYESPIDAFLDHGTVDFPYGRRAKPSLIQLIQFKSK